MDVDAKFFAVLKPLPCVVSKPPGEKTEDTYVTYHEVLGNHEAFAGNRALRSYHMVQVHAFSRLDDGTHRTIFDQAIALLNAAGIRVRSWGPDTYETDTKIFHIAATCEWRQSTKED